MVQAGFRKLLSVEWDPDASATLRRNFPDSCHYEGDIRDLKDSDILDYTKGRSVAVVCGGPPCQGFSVAGLRRPDDERNTLFLEFIR
jgi:DNA (cytosine-5)-methyltransferase 1